MESLKFVPISSFNPSACADPPTPEAHLQAEVLGFEGNCLAHDDELQSTTPARLILTRCVVFCGLASCIPLLMSVAIPLWFQPTAIGLLWGGLFIAGFMLGGIRSGMLLPAFAAFLCSGLFGYSFYVLTDLAAADCLLIAALLLSSGWLTARLDHLNVCGTRNPRQTSRQWSIADIAFVTTMAACLSQALPNLTTPPILLFSVLLALVASLACSWIAYRWVWNDDWSLLRVALVVATLAAVTVYLHACAPTGMTLLEAASWVLSGPGNVIAAQSVAVLFVLAIIRFELQHQRAPTAAAL